jgi:hypothetical protein
VFTYRVYDEDGNELGEAAYTQRIKPGETVWLSGARQVRVTSVVDTQETDRYEGLLMIRVS